MSTFTDNLQAKRTQTTQAQKEQSEFRAMITEMRKTQAATLAGQGKPPVILTDQTDLGDKIHELTTRTVAAIQGLDTADWNKQQLSAIRELKGCLEAVETAVGRYETAIERQTMQLVSALNKLELKPQITVPTPEVVINEKAINLKPLEKAINSLKTVKSVNLSDYRAHDLDTAPDGQQYIGYIAIDGSWYIIQSNDDTNTMRYCFGADGYATGWGERYSHDYTTLSEAIRGLAA